VLLLRTLSSIAVGLLLAANADAGSELRELYRGARATAMGGAFVAVADDEQAIFMNPAGLAQITGSTLNLVPLVVEASSEAILNYATYLAAFTQPAATDTLTFLMGKSLQTRVQAAPALVFPGFGFAVLADQEIASVNHDPYYPKLQTTFQTTDGVQAAFGQTVLKLNRGRTRVSVGLGAKVLWRRGGTRTLSAFDLLSGLSGGDYNQFVTQAFGGFGMGYGGDAGVLVTHQMRDKMTLRFGAAMTEIGDISFGEADPQKGNLSVGASFTFKSRDLTGTFSYDFRHILADADWRKKNHLGLELSLPLITLYGGVNGVHPTYGASFDLWVLKFTGMHYTEDVGALIDQSAQGRFLLQVQLKMPI
jgi:hypothetical protein